METMGKWERLQAAIAGAPVDRVPVSAWRHFIADERTAGSLAGAMLRFQQEYDWDFLKINARGIYMAEAWGNEYDYDDYGDWVVPRPVRAVLVNRDDLAGFTPVDPATGPLGEQLAAVRLVGEGLAGAVPYLATVFSPLTVVEQLIKGRSMPADTPEQAGVRRWLTEAPDLLHHVLHAVAETTAAFAQFCLEAGAWGIFLGISRMARKDYLSEQEYREFGRPYDLLVLNAVREARLNAVHICGPGVHLDPLLDYPCALISYNAGEGGNPNPAALIARAGKAVATGVDHGPGFATASPGEMRATARRAIAASGGRRFILAPGCTFPPSTPTATLRAFRQAVES